MVQITDESNRLLAIYENMSGDLPEDLTLMFSVTDESYMTAKQKAWEILHMQGKSRRLAYSDESFLPPSSQFKEDFVDEGFRDTIKNLLNRYISHIRNSESNNFKIRALIVFLMIGEHFSIISELSLTEEEVGYVNAILNYIVSERSAVVQELIEFFNSNDAPLHAKRTESLGVKVFEIKTGPSIERSFADITTEEIPFNTYEVILGLRARYLSVCETPKINEFSSLAEISERSFRRKRAEIIDELHNFVTDDELRDLNNLIIN